MAFAGDRAVGYAANLCSRLASRILHRVIQGRYRNDDDIYKIAARVAWDTWLTPDLTLRVDLNATRSPLRSLNFATLRVKDGIVDQMRKSFDARPSIDTENPDTRVFVYLDDRFATLYLDWSGQALFKRGWRSEVDSKGVAPLKENLAAGLLHLSGWRPGIRLADPFCGSGTILIEAAQWASGMSPGIHRSFGFERLRDFDRALWHQVREQRAQQPAVATALTGSDVDAAIVSQARVNLQRAGLPASAVQFSVTAAERARPAAIVAGSELPGMIVTNPPYGERLEMGSAWSTLGAHWRRAYEGWQISVLTSDRELPRQLGIRERRKIPLFNGAIECRLFLFDIFQNAR